MKNEDKDIEVCNYCDEQVSGIGDDGISYCDSCGIVEGNTRWLTEDEYENLYEPPKNKNKETLIQAGAQ